MTDFFALLDQPRRPWLDPDQVQAKFLSLSADSHPDRVHNASLARQAEANRCFAELNSACACLRDTKERLRHLLELERGAPLSNLERLPSAALDFYFKLGQLCRDADQFLAQKSKAASPLLQLRFFEEANRWREQLENWQAVLAERRAGLEGRIQELNRAWEQAPPVGNRARPGALPLGEVEQLYREYSYVTRWSGQVLERLVQLAF